MKKVQRKEQVHTDRHEEKRTDSWLKARLLRLLSIAMLLIVTAAASSTIAYLTKGSRPVTNVFSAAPKYTLTYHENDGENPTSVTNMPAPKEEISYTGKFAISEKIPQRAGYVFLGWNTKADGSGVDVAYSGDSANPVIYTAEVQHTDLYAIWRPDKYQLIYDPNGGNIDGILNQKYTDEANDSADAHTFTIKSDTELVLSHANASRVFMGWADTPDATEPVYGYHKQGWKDNGSGEAVAVSDLSDEITITSPNKQKTIYAVWAIKYTLRFDENTKYHGVGPVPADMVFIGTGSSKRFYLPGASTGPVPTRVGYQFQWWSYTEDRIDKEPHVKFGEYVDLTADNPDVTLWARYYPLDEALLYFNGNAYKSDGTAVKVNNLPEINPEFAKIPAEAPNFPFWSFNLPDNRPTAEGRTFLGWSKDPNATEAEYQPGELFEMNLDKTSVTTLYAVWFPPHRFSITVHANGDGAKINYVGFNSYSLWNGWTKEYASDYSSVQVFSGEYDVNVKQAQVIYRGGFKAEVERKNYRLAGFSTRADATEDDLEYPLNQYNYMDGEIIVECTDAECPGNTVHNLDLYAIWVPQHSISFRFYENMPGANPGEKVNYYSHYYIHGSNITGATDWNDHSYVAAYGPKDVDEKTFVLPVGTFTYAYAKDASYARFLGWSTNPNATEPDELYKLKVVNGSKTFANDFTFTVDEDDCEPGAVHEVVTLYGVWEPLHRFGVKFVWNQTGTYGQYERWHFGFGGGYTGVTDRVYYTPIIPASQTSYTVAAGTAGGALESISGYDFLGWASSKEKADAGIVDYPLNEDGYFINEFVFTDPDLDCEGGYAPTSNENNMNVTSHIVKTLYGVWRPKHAFSISLHLNSSGGVLDTGSIPDGKRTGYQTMMLLQSPDLPLSETSFTIAANTLYAEAKNRTGFNFLGWSTDPNATVPDAAYAVAKSAADNHYYFVNDIVLNEPDPNCAGGNVVHNVLNLYAVWEPLHSFGIRFNTNTGMYQTKLEFDNYNNDGGYYYVTNNYGYFRTKYMSTSITEWTIPAGFKANLTWYKDKVFVGWASSQADADAGITDSRYELDENGCFKYDVVIKEDRDPCNSGNVDHLLQLYPVLKDAHTLSIKFDQGIADYMNYVPTDGLVRSVEIPQDQLTYTFDAGTVKATAAKRNYTFLGWSTNPNATEAEYEIDSSFIKKPITVNLSEHDANCSAGDTHITLTLYPVFDFEYRLIYNGNGGINIPDIQTYHERAPFVGSHEFTIYDDVSNNNPPVRQRYRFLGWATSANATLGEYGYKNEANDELGSLTKNLSNTIEISEATRYQTLYAIWCREYKYMFDANGGTGAPEDTFKYTSTANDSIAVPSDIPTKVEEGTGKVYTFLGWASTKEKADAGVVEYKVKPAGQAETSENRIVLQCGNDGYAEIKLYAVWEDPNTAGGD